MLKSLRITREPRRTSRRYALMALILSLIVVACTNTYQSSPFPVNKLSIESTDLRIWWDKDSQNQPQHHHYLRLSRRYVFIVFTLSLIIIACTNTSKLKQSSVTHPSTDSTVLKIWWDKGFTVDEDEAIQQLVSNWQKQTGNKVKLSLYIGDQLPQKARRAIQAGNPPDIMMSYGAERALNPHLAWEGKRRM